jgi:AcrR family transcriptional regulator
MGRRAPDNRIQDLVEAATAVFIAQGYRRAQMADVAEALGVAKGTLYLYVESKEALFDLALRHADAPRPIAAPGALPVRTPAPGSTLRYVEDRLAARPASPTLARALERGRLPAPGAPAPRARPALERRGPVASAGELAQVLRELSATMTRNRTGIKLVDRCAAEYPELAKLWFVQGREALLGQLTRYIESARWGRELPDAAVAARLVLETIVFWAVHRHWDPAPQTVDDRTAEDTVVQLLVRALTGGRPS